MTRICLTLALLFLSAWAAAAADGRSLYLDNCASCHGENLEGQPNWQTQNADGTLPAPPHDESGHTWHHGDKLLFAYTKFGGEALMEARGIGGFKSGMPAFKDALSDAEITAILGYIRSTWSDRVRAIQAERSAAEQ